MACKHEGGSDPCRTNTRGRCLDQAGRINRRCVEKRRKKGGCRYCSGKAIRGQVSCRKCKDHRKTSHQSGSGRPYADRRTGDIGAAAEHFVISELLKLNLPTGGPYNQNGKHDVFVKVGGAWRTVQVKVASVWKPTNKIINTGIDWRRITSDLVALVDLQGRRIRWESNTKERVPKELET